MSLIAIDRIHNYYQYKDAEAKFYESLNNEKRDEEIVGAQQPVPSEQNAVEIKSKKPKKNKKVTSSSESSPNEQAVEKPTGNVSSAPPKEEDTSKTDSSQLTGTAKKNAAKKKKQREKKAAAAALAKQNEQAPPPEIPKSVTESNDSQNAPNVTTKAKDKKKKAKPAAPTEQKDGVANSTSTLATEIAKAREHIKSSLDRVVNLNNMPGSELLERISSLEKDNQDLHGIINGLQNLVVSLEGRLNKLEGGSAPAPAKSAPAPTKADEDDDDVDLFGSEDEDEEAEKLKEERVKAYAEKKSKKPALIAKSSILLDCKPWDDETDMAAMEKQVRTIVMDGLLWGASKLVPLAYGIKKLQIMCVIEDDKVSVDELTEKIQEFEDFVQSVDIAAFNKI